MQDTKWIGKKQSHRALDYKLWYMDEDSNCNELGVAIDNQLVGMQWR